MSSFQPATDECDLSDAVLLARSHTEPELFVYLVRRYEAAFIRKARTVLRTEEDVEEVVQDTFTKMYLAAHRFETVAGANVRSWGYTILMNTAFTRYQKCKREAGLRTELEPEQFESLADTVHEQSFHLEVSDYVTSILAKMPEQLARVLDAHFIRDLPQQQIALAEGVSLGAIKTRVHRAKNEFRTIASQHTRF